MRLFILNMSGSHPNVRSVLVIARDLEDAQQTVERHLFTEMREYADSHEQAMGWVIKLKLAGSLPIAEVPATVVGKGSGGDNDFMAILTADGKTCIASNVAQGKPE